MTALVILAGGRGMRMSGNKPFHPWQHHTLIEAVIERVMPQVDRLLINVGRRNTLLADRLEALGCPLLFDAPEASERGPLSGVLKALQWAQAQELADIVTVPCDMPYLPPDMVRQLPKAEKGEVVIFSGIRDYPLCARWSSSLTKNLAETLSNAATGMPVMHFLDGCTVRRIVIRDNAAFVNINSPDDCR